jgi:Flp pilus assembly protein TadD
MKRWLLGVAVVLAAGIGITLVARPRTPEWTTSSPAARAEFEAANESRMKLYYPEARDHLEKALALDPDFVIAKSILIGMLDRDDVDRREHYIEELKAADLDQLTEREQCLVRRSLAVLDKQPDVAAAILDACIERLPDDPYLLNEKAMMAWNKEDYEHAERLFRRLVEIAPNWVIAYNQLGYITMQQERFVEAREYFVSYRYIAPDQANPYDSLGELHIIQGQWDEALASLEKAIEIRPDFWNSYDHMVLVLVLMDRLDDARAVVDRLEAMPDHPEKMPDRERCVIRFVELGQRHADREILKEAADGCADDSDASYIAMSAHLAAVRLGQWDRAEEIEQGVRELLSKQSSHQKWMDDADGALAHMEGVRLARQGHLDEAVERLRAADDSLSFREAGIGILKLVNRLVLVETLLADGQDAEGHKLLSEVRAINPPLVGEFETDGLRIVGLSRG